MNEFNPYSSPSQTSGGDAKPLARKGKPIGGWLILLAIGLALSPLAILGELLRTHLPLFSDGTLAQLEPVLAGIIVLEAIVNLGFAVASVWLLVMMLLRSRVSFHEP